MLLESFEVQNFRNLHGKIIFGGGLNLLLGDNGQGKTNWLEAIHVLSTTRSFRTARLQEAIHFGEDTATIRGIVRRSADIHRDLQAVLEVRTKSFAVNGKRETIQRYLGQLHALVFNADELEIVRGNPDRRRKFLDGAIVSIYPPFIQTLSDYSRVIRQKNFLLQSARENKFPLEKISELLEPWNGQLVALATRVHKSRVRFVERLNEGFEKRLFGNEEISIRYVSALEEKGDLSDYQGLIAERLKMRVQAEVVSGYALVGTHRDDLEILFDGHDIRKFGSAGQQRSALLLLLLASLSVYYSQHQEYPLFLLDDIDAELDYKRIGQLLEFLDGKTQTFVTTSKESFVEIFGGPASIFAIENGAAKSL